MSSRIRVLTVGMTEPFNRALGSHPEVELHITADPQATEHAARSLAGIVRGVVPYRLARHKIDLSAAATLRWAVREYRPDVLQIYLARDLAAALLATTCLRNPPQLASFRGIQRRVSLFDPGDSLTFGHPRVGIHLCASHAVRQAMLESGLAASRCHTVYDTYRTTPTLGRAALSAWNIPPNALVVGCIANMRRVKGVDLLLRAVLECNDLEICLVLIGQILDREVQTLVEDPRLRDRVRLLGFQGEAASLISGADLFVMPSRSEGLCVALLEAMSHGVCPIVSEAGGMKEVVRDGQDGIVVPREDVAALAKAIRTLCLDADLRRYYAQSAAKRVAGEFSGRRLAERVVDSYRAAMAAARPERNHLWRTTLGRHLWRRG